MKSEVKSIRPSVRQASPLSYSAKNESKELQVAVAQCNEANAGKGLKFLRSFLSNVVTLPGWAAAKPIYAALNSACPSDAVALARVLLSQSYETKDEQIINTQIGAFVKKYPFSGDTDVRIANATKKFLRGERRNRHMNALLVRRRLRTNLDNPTVTSDPFTGFSGIGQDPSQKVAWMRAYISRVIGSKPPISEIFKECRWGPGAAVGVSGQFTHFARKLLAEKWTVTPAAIPYVLSAAKRYPMFWELLGLARNTVRDVPSVTDPSEMLQEGRCYICVDPDSFDQRMLERLEIVQHNKVAFVPKDADCDRTIASEPLMNQFLQLAVDAFMKKCLKRFGINLSDQGTNQAKAREGSILGWLNSYCTIDLKNASGSVFLELVRELLPADWFLMLNALRAPEWSLGSGEPVRYHGFVSMGNGYCFPLETLIFASICSAAHRYTGTHEDFVVYGDDVLIRQNEALVVLEYLRYFGFEVNTDKSFFFGPFRESCGADWYDGEQVRPVFLDDALDSIEQRIRAHNALARLPNRWAEPLAQACRNWFPGYISKLCRPFADDTDEAVDNRHATIQNPWHMRCITYRTPAWYGLAFRAIGDDEIEQHMYFDVAYRFGALMGASSVKPFAMRRETQMSVKRFTHGGGKSQDFPHETGTCDMSLKRSRPHIRICVCGWTSSNLR
ncbi:TPA_asm: RNA-directed RNA polymerase [ssRNA phage SRR6960509_14]|uniref:RNA-directed RNA polymerase n=1 Tax=ssRNA phage SRR6960509_14 TaxID=2786525 RepID=A0A8S5L566_9VIRU|nr:RNA-directed RNA polymerase [ssRNA phage SRR6960509_14]DAD52564.1 TPA_asm: RNA-directed RNA polymerase [ssRNA phage SRR6960509_14]